MARIILCGILFVSPILFGQVPRPTAAISGRVLDAGTNEPVVGATVLITALDAATGTPPVAPSVTNGRGEFSFAQLATGRYDLAAHKPRYLSLGHGQRPGSGLPGVSVMATAGQQVNDLIIRLPLASVIAGYVTDTRGDPAQGAAVQLYVLEWRNGERGARFVSSDVVDDRGQYRVPGLAPGDYVLSATMAVPAPLRPAPTYYPGTPVAALALPISVGVSEERAGVNVQMSAAVLATVSGMAVSTDGKPLSNIKVAAIDMTSALKGFTFRTTYSSGTGAFTFDNLAPGQYALVASEDQPKGPDGSRWARTDLTIDGSAVKDLSLVLRGGEVLSGTVLVEGARPVQVAARLILSPLDWDPQYSASFSARTESDGRFSIGGVKPGRYRLIVSELPEGHVVRAAKLNGSDVCDLPLEVQPGQASRTLEVRLSPRAASVSGTLFDSTGNPNSDLLVIAFPSEERYWLPGSPRIRTVRPASDGKYSLRSLPSGAYRIGVVTDAQPGEWFASSFLQKLVPTSVPVTLADGDARTLDVRVK